MDYSETKFPVKGGKKLAYGIPFPEHTPDYMIELHCCFRYELTVEDGGVGKKEHFWRFIEIMYPTFAQRDNYFMDVFFENVLSGNYKHYFCIGPGGFGKTTLSALVAIGLWIENPSVNTVFACTTTISSSEGRIWGKIKEMYSYHQEEFEKFSKITKNTIYYRTKLPSGSWKTSKKHAMKVQPLPRGEGGADNVMRGDHPDEKLLVILDEMDQSASIDSVIENLTTGGVDFTLIGLGNPLDRNSALGLSCEPYGGWGSVNPLTFKNIKDCCWDSAIPMGRVLFFPGYLNPRIVLSAKYPDKTDYYAKRFKFFSSKEVIDEKKHNLSYEKWMEQYIGFFAEGASSGMHYVIQKTDIERLSGHKLGVFYGSGDVVRLAGCDPSFSHGGDKCIYHVAKFGILKNQKQGLCFQNAQERHEIVIPPRSQMTSTLVDFLYDEIMKLNQKYGIKPSHFSMDVANRGADVADRLIENWGSIHQVDPKGGASGKTLYRGRDTTAKEDCGNRVTELWMIAAKLILSGQIKGIDDIIIKQITSRAIMQKATKSKKTLEPKDDYRKRMTSIGRRGRSPDEADTFTFIIDNARELGLVIDFSKKREAENRNIYSQILNPTLEDKAEVDRREIEELYDSLNAYDFLEDMETSEDNIW